MERPPKSRTKNILVHESGDEFLLYDLETDKAFCLNDTSALVWQNCDGKNSVSDIRRVIAKNLKVSISKKLVELALIELRKDNLLKNSSYVVSELSRRDLIERVARTSVVALPLILSVTAPRAASAQSGGFANGVVCASNPQCQSNCCGDHGSCCASANGTDCDNFPSNCVAQ